MFPSWLHALSIAALLVGGACSLGIAMDVYLRPQEMGVMNVVWPLAALFGTALVVWLYVRHGRVARPGSEGAPGSARQRPRRPQPFSVAVAKGSLHCGAGCTLGDIVAEWLGFTFPGVATAFGWHTLFGQKIFALWLFDFVVAFVLGVAFQYLAIVPMRHLKPGAGLVAALKADTLSLFAWQVGMYGLMAWMQWGWFESAYGIRAEVDSPEFWFAMQLSMLAGLVTAYPVNWWLIKGGVKEAM